MIQPQKPKMYVSLPITGVEHLQDETERLAFNRVKSLGYWAYLPSRLAKRVETVVEKPKYKHYISFDLWTISRCDAMLLMHGWENSIGCKIEIKFALKYDIPIFRYNMVRFTKMDYIKGIIGNFFLKIITKISKK